MVVDPPPDVGKIRSKDGTVDSVETNTTRVTTLPNSIYSSSNLKNTEAIKVHVSAEELLNAQRIVALQNCGLLSVKGDDGIESSSPRLHTVQGLQESNVKIDSTVQAHLNVTTAESPESSLQIRRDSGDIRVVGPAGVYYPSQDAAMEHIYTGETFAGKQNSGGAGAPAMQNDQTQCQKAPEDEAQLLGTKSHFESVPFSSNFISSSDNNGVAGAPMSQFVQNQYQQVRNSVEKVSNYKTSLESPQTSSNSKSRHDDFGGAGAPVTQRARDQCQELHQGGMKLPSYIECLESSPSSSNSKSRQDTHEGEMHSSSGFGTGAFGLVDNQHQQHDHVNQLNENMHILDNTKLSNQYSKIDKRALGTAHQCNSVEVVEHQGAAAPEAEQNKGNNSDKLASKPADLNVQKDTSPVTSCMLKSIGTQLHPNANENHGAVLNSAMQGREFHFEKGAGNNLQSSGNLLHPNATEQHVVAVTNVVKNLPNQHNFPKISSNFDKPNQNNQATKLGPSQAQPKEHILTPNHQQTGGPNNQQPQKNPFPNRRDQVPQPAPYTVVQTFASKLRINQARTEAPFVLSTPTHTSRQGLPAVLFEKEDILVKLAARCKYTLVGKFSYTMPKIELVRKSFITQTQLSGGVKIAHFNARHVYIDLDNELDYNTVWTKQRMNIEGQWMRIQTWTPTFKPDEETPIVPIWVALPELPWHCYDKAVVTALLSSVGKVLYLDTASIQKTRGSIAKVRVQVDLTKERPPHVWMGYDKQDPTIGRWQAIHYENVPEYCMYCKHQGHMQHVCNIKKKDEEQKRRKEEEAVKKNKSVDSMNGIDQEELHFSNVQTINNAPAGMGSKDQEAAQLGRQQLQAKVAAPPVQAQVKAAAEKKVDEGWQIQRRKQHKGTHNGHQNNAVGTTGPKDKGKNIPTQQKNNISGKAPTPNFHSHSNIYADLAMQDQPTNQIAGEDTTTKNSSMRKQPANQENTSTQGPGIDLRLPNTPPPHIQCTGAPTRIPGIDLLLPIPLSPTSYISDVVAAEVVGGLEGIEKENLINLQDGVSKRGGNISQAMHENSNTDLRCVHRAPEATADVDHHNIELPAIAETEEQPFVHLGSARPDMTPQTNKGSMAKDMGSLASTSVTASTAKTSKTDKGTNSQVFNNKSTLSLSKKKRDSIKRKLSQEMNPGQQVVNYVLVPEQEGIQVTPLQIQDNSDELLSKGVTSEELDDEYRVIQSEEEEDPDQGEEADQEDQLEAFRCTMEALLQKESQQANEKKSMSPGSKQERKKNKQNTTSGSANVAVKSNINTRSKSHKI